MLSETRKRDYVLVIVWSGLLLGGLLLFVSGITHEGLWLDECFSAMAASGTLVDLWHTVIALTSIPHCITRCCTYPWRCSAIRPWSCGCHRRQRRWLWRLWVPDRSDGLWG